MTNIFTLQCKEHAKKENKECSPWKTRGKFRRQFLTSTSADVTFTDPHPLLFPSQTRKYRPRTFWYPYFWLWWPAGSEQLEQREGGEISSTSHTGSQSLQRRSEGETEETDGGMSTFQMDYNDWGLSVSFMWRVFKSTLYENCWN